MHLMLLLKTELRNALLENTAGKPYESAGVIDSNWCEIGLCKGHLVLHL